MASIAALTHIYYHYSYNIIKPALQNLASYNTAFLFSISLDCLALEGYKEQLKKDFPGCYIIETPNLGKDIGGKLALIDLYLKLKLTTDYTILLHDKVSPQALNGIEWRDKLLKIINTEEIPSILELFNTNQQTGIIANTECISNEYDAATKSFTGANATLLNLYLSTYRIKPSGYNFVGGTMFWVRSSILKDFFSKYSPIEFRGKLESGNVLDNKTGTHTHTIERFLSLIPESYGYKMQGI